MGKFEMYLEEISRWENEGRGSSLAPDDLERQGVAICNRIIREDDLAPVEIGGLLEAALDAYRGLMEEG